LSHTLALSFVFCFWESWPGLLQTYDLPASVSAVVRIIGICHHTWFTDFHFFLVQSDRSFLIIFSNIWMQKLLRTTERRMIVWRKVSQSQELHYFFLLLSKKLCFPTKSFVFGRAQEKILASGYWGLWILIVHILPHTNRVLEQLTESTFLLFSLVQ
jgi:hypothetical protein